MEEKWKGRSFPPEFNQSVITIKFVENFDICLSFEQRSVDGGDALVWGRKPV